MAMAVAEARAKIFDACSLHRHCHSMDHGHRNAMPPLFRRDPPVSVSNLLAKTALSIGEFHPNDRSPVVCGGFALPDVLTGGQDCLDRPPMSRPAIARAAQLTDSAMRAHAAAGPRAPRRLST